MCIRDRRHTERETYAGLLDEYRVGISLIFYIENSMEYRICLLYTSVPVNPYLKPVIAYLRDSIFLC